MQKRGEMQQEWRNTKRTNTNTKSEISKIDTPLQKPHLTGNKRKFIHIDSKLFSGGGSVRN